MVWDWRVLRAGPMFFHRPKLLVPLLSSTVFKFFFLWFVLWGWGLRTEECKLVTPSLALPTSFRMVSCGWCINNTPPATHHPLPTIASHSSLSSAHYHLPQLALLCPISPPAARSPLPTITSHSSLFSAHCQLPQLALLCPVLPPTARSPLPTTNSYSSLFLCPLSPPTVRSAMPTITLSRNELIPIRKFIRCLVI